MLALAGAAPPQGALDVRLEQIRNDRGTLLLCLTREPRHFPECAGDPDAVTRTLPAGDATVSIAGLVPGTYALAVLHDENGNGRLDRRLGIPIEGFGFSRNPALRFGPPRFPAVRFVIGRGATRQAVRLRYLL